MKWVVLLVGCSAGFVAGACWAANVPQYDPEGDGLLLMADDLADGLDEAIGYVDEYFVKKHEMTRPLDVWRAKSGPVWPRHAPLWDDDGSR